MSNACFVNVLTSYLRTRWFLQKSSAIGSKAAAASTFWAWTKMAPLSSSSLSASEDGGHMEVQSIRYAAMVSTMTFEQAVEAHRKYLLLRGSTVDPAEAILSFLGTEKPQLSGSVRIVLASAEFSKK